MPSAMSSKLERRSLKRRDMSRGWCRTLSCRSEPVSQSSLALTERLRNLEQVEIRAAGSGKTHAMTRPSPHTSGVCNVQPC